MEKNRYGTLLMVQIVLTVAGTILALYNFVNTIGQGPTLLGFLFAVVYLASYIALIVYAGWGRKKQGDFPFQITVYAYAALLGIQILQNGQFLSSIGLSEGLTLFINTANLIAFANVIKFSDLLNDRKKAYAYLLTAVALKLAGELALIVVFAGNVQVMQVLMALSVPILGATLLVVYLYRLERLRMQA
ncbi:MAG: hypothetical protein IJ131_04320 [Eggerthellaceae bacterium]|nr:hypothetical protein [Eggerthellaceae bacterium]